MIRFSPERTMDGSATPSASTRPRRTSSARSVAAASAFVVSVERVSSTIWVPPRRSSPRRTGTVTATNTARATTANAKNALIRLELFAVELFTWCLQRHTAAGTIGTAGERGEERGLSSAGGRRRGPAEVGRHVRGDERPVPGHRGRTHRPVRHSRRVRGREQQVAGGSGALTGVAQRPQEEGAAAGVRLVGVRRAVVRLEGGRRGGRRVRGGRLPGGHQPGAVGEGEGQQDRRQGQETRDDAVRKAGGMS